MNNIFLYQIRGYPKSRTFQYLSVHLGGKSPFGEGKINLYHSDLTYLTKWIDDRLYSSKKVFMFWWKCNKTDRTASIFIALQKLEFSQQTWKKVLNKQWYHCREWHMKDYLGIKLILLDFCRSVMIILFYYVLSLYDFNFFQVVLIV